MIEPLSFNFRLFTGYMKLKEFYYFIPFGMLTTSTASGQTRVILGVFKHMRTGFRCSGDKSSDWNLEIDGGLFMSLFTRKPAFRLCDQVSLEPTSSATETSMSLESLAVAGSGTCEPRCEKTGLRGFRPGPTQTGLYSHGSWLEA